MEMQLRPPGHALITRMFLLIFRGNLLPSVARLLIMSKSETLQSDVQIIKIEEEMIIKDDLGKGFLGKWTIWEKGFLGNRRFGRKVFREIDDLG